MQKPDFFHSENSPFWRKFFFKKTILFNCFIEKTLGAENKLGIKKKYILNIFISDGAKTCLFTFFFYKIKFFHKFHKFQMFSKKS